MRGDILRSVLEVAGETAANTLDFFAAFLTAGYGASYGKLAYEFSKHQRARKRHAQLQKAAKKYQKLMHKLRHDGLLQPSGKKTPKAFILTKKGRTKLAWLRERAANRMPIPTYAKEPSRHLVIVAFDVPEYERKKRLWLRSALKNLGFTMIQRSVWIGKTSIPEAFLGDLRRLNLLDCVEIFAVTKGGSLQTVA